MIADLTNEELVAAILRLKSPAYVGLSRTHADYLEELELEASRRGLKV